jgi:hypothetical protein
MGVLDAPMKVVAQTVVSALVTGKAILRRRTTSYNRTTGVESVTEVDHEVKVSPSMGYKLSEIDGRSILRGDFRVILPAAELEVEPDPLTDLLVRGGLAYKVISAHPISSGDENAAFVLQLRK